MPLSKSKRHDNTGDDGFTLLETLVALLILSLSLGAAFQHLSINSGKLSRSQHSKSVSQLVTHLMSKDRISSALRNKTIQGKTGPLNWTMNTSRFNQTGELILVTVSIEDKTRQLKPLLFKRVVATDEYSEVESKENG